MKRHEGCYGQVTRTVRCFHFIGKVGDLERLKQNRPFSVHPVKQTVTMCGEVGRCVRFEARMASQTTLASKLSSPNAESE